MSMAAKRPLKCKKNQYQYPAQPGVLFMDRRGFKAKAAAAARMYVRTVIQDHPSQPASGPSEQ
jgi:hypothetical protein